MFKVVGIIVIVMILFGGLTIGYQKIFGVWKANTDREVYQSSKSYVEGTIRDLRNLQVQYETVEPDQQEALKSLILHRANELNDDVLPADLRDFVTHLRR